MGRGDRGGGEREGGNMRDRQGEWAGSGRERGREGESWR